MNDQDNQHKYVVSSTPHIREKTGTHDIMFDVMLALAPACAADCYFFGWRAFAILGLSIASSVLFEYLYRRAMKKTNTIGDFSAVVTAMLLAMNLPASVPFWIPILGSAVSIILVKQLFGGIGQNFLNPALAARAFLLVSFPAEMTNWSVMPIGAADAVAGATPLAALKQAAEPIVSNGNYWNMVKDAFFGVTGGTIGETCALALLIGAAYLLIKKIISWRIPAAYIGSFAVLTFLFGRWGFMTGDPLYEVLIGGLMLGAFFMATDYTTSPVTSKGQIIMGIGCGIFTFIIRRFSSAYPEGVSFAILLMNLCVPLIERYTRPRVYGKAKGRSSANGQKA